MKRIFSFVLVLLMIFFLNSVVSTNFAQDTGISDDTINIQDKDDDDKEWEDNDKNLEKQKAFVKEMNEKAQKIVLDWIKNLNRDEFIDALKEIADRNNMIFGFKEKDGIVIDYLGFEKEYFDVDNLEFSFIPKIFERISYQCSKKFLSEVVTEICGDLNYVFPQIEGEERFVTCNFKNISRIRILHSIMRAHGYNLLINNIEYLYEHTISNNFRLDISLEFIFDVIWQIIDEVEEELYAKLREVYEETLEKELTDEIALAHMIIENADFLTELFLQGTDAELKKLNDKNYIITIQLPY